MIKRVGLSMRVVEESRYKESRDALAHDWAKFFLQFPAIQWVPIPNLGDQSANFVKSWGIEGIILTGGNDVGRCEVRDETEANLLAFALEGNLPIFGVCRGFQFVNQFLGGKLKADSMKTHAGVNHEVFLLPPIGQDNPTVVVNSYHEFLIERLADQLVPLARDKDDHVEAAVHLTQKIGGVLWHPEREAKVNTIDKYLLELIFGWKLQ